MEPIVQWLEGLGPGQYGPAFVEADIDLSVLPRPRRGRSGKARSKTRPPEENIARDCPAGVACTRRCVGIARAARGRAAPAHGHVLRPGGLDGAFGALDPEDLRAVIGAYHRCCAEVIGRSGGFVAKYMGDGVLAYFGYP